MTSRCSAYIETGLRGSGPCLQWKSFGSYIQNIDAHDVDLDLVFAYIINVRKDLDSKKTTSFVGTSTMCRLIYHMQTFHTSDRSQMCKYWKFLEMIKLMMTFIRASREGNWMLHLCYFREMLPCLCAYDQINYAI